LPDERLREEAECPDERLREEESVLMSACAKKRVS